MHLTASQGGMGGIHPAIREGMGASHRHQGMAWEGMVWRVFTTPLGQ